MAISYMEQFKKMLPSQVPPAPAASGAPPVHPAVLLASQMGNQGTINALQSNWSGCTYDLTGMTAEQLRDEYARVSMMPSPRDQVYLDAINTALINKVMPDSNCEAFDYQELSLLTPEQLQEKYNALYAGGQSSLNAAGLNCDATYIHAIDAKMRGMGPVSGYEPVYNPDRINTDPSLLNTINCYAYAANWDKNPATKAPFPHKLQPGEVSGFKVPVDQQDPIAAGVSITQMAGQDAAAAGYQFLDSNLSDACPPGTYKVALVVSPQVWGPAHPDFWKELTLGYFGSDEQHEEWSYDYHWYRQNPDQNWSHKPGQTPVTNRDVKKNDIPDPAKAERNDGVRDYSYFEGYHCIGPQTHCNEPDLSKATVASLMEGLQILEAKAAMGTADACDNQYLHNIETEMQKRGR